MAVVVVSDEEAPSLTEAFAIARRQHPAGVYAGHIVSRSGEYVFKFDDPISGSLVSGRELAKSFNRLHGGSDPELLSLSSRVNE